MSGADAEVLVVGGGPAGSATALLLARAGVDVLLVDRAHFPRPKPCGECLSPGALTVLDRLGLSGEIGGLGPARLEGWRVRTPGVDVSARFGRGLHGAGIPRSALDAALLEAVRSAGARVEEGVRVQGVRPPAVPGAYAHAEVRRPGGGKVTVRARLVVGADGLRSVVARSVGALARSPLLRKVSLSARLRWQAPHDGIGVLDVADGVTLGLAPVGQGLWNVTVVTSADRHGRRLAEGAQSFLEGVLRERLGAGSAAEIVDGPWASGPFDWPVRRMFAPGVLLVGDAAGYFDPFTGQGIYRALRTGELAAAAASSFLSAPARGWGPLASYHRRWRREVRASAFVQEAVEAVMARPLLRDIALRRLAASGGLAGLIRVTGDAAPVATLCHPGTWIGRPC